MRNHIIFLLLALCLFIGCQGYLEGIRTLESVESYIESRPDSALAVLERMDGGHFKTRRNRALFSVLYAHALDKNDINTSDVSVVMPAVEYYGKRGPAEKAMKAWFYLGREQENGKDYTAAIISYTKANEWAAKTDDLSFRGLIASAMAELYEKNYNGEKFFEKMTDAKVLFNEAGDSLRSWIATAVLASACTDYGKWKTADSLYKEFFNHEVWDSSCVSYYLRDYARYHILKPEPNPEKIIELLDKCINEYGYELSEYNCGLYALACAKLGNFEKCDELFRENGYCMEDCPFAYNIYKEKGEYISALEKLEENFDIDRDLISQNMNQSVSEAQVEYFQAKSELLDKNRKNERVIYVLVSLILLLLLVISVFAAYSMRNRMFQAKERIADLREISRLNLHKIDSVRRDLDAKEQELDALRRSYLTGSKSRFELIVGLTSEYMSPSHSETKDRIYDKVQELVAEINGKSENNRVFEQRINSVFEDVMTKLRDDFTDFSDLDFRFLSYVIVGFDAKTISLMTGLSTSNIYTKKKRMTDKILSSGSPNIQIYSACFNKNV